MIQGHRHYSHGVDIEDTYTERQTLVVEIDGELHRLGIPVGLLSGGAPQQVTMLLPAELTLAHPIAAAKMSPAA